MVTVIALVACDRPGTQNEPAPPTSTVPTTIAPASTLPSPQALSADEMKALEGSPASTPPLVDAIAPPTVAVDGLEGVPGPSPAFGPPDAAVRVYVFTDFQCPVCRRTVEPLKLLARNRSNDVRVIVKHSALPHHDQAALAADASLAAFRQGNFWAYHDQLFLRQRLDEPSLLATATAIDLDATQLIHDMEDESVTAQVVYETAVASRFRLTSTPTFVVNGHVQRGWASYHGLAAVVDRELERARRIAAEGVPAPQVAYEATKRSGEDGPALAAALFEQAD